MAVQSQAVRLRNGSNELQALYDRVTGEHTTKQPLEGGVALERCRNSVERKKRATAKYVVGQNPDSLRMITLVMEIAHTKLMDVRIKAPQRRQPKIPTHLATEGPPYRPVCTYLGEKVWMQCASCHKPAEFLSHNISISCNAHLLIDPTSGRKV